MEQSVTRIERRAGVDGIADALADRLKASDLNSLLMDVFRRRAARRRPPEVLADYQANRFTHPKPLDPRELLAWDFAAFAALPAGFEPIELSPLAPLATCSAVATVHPDKSLATTRSLEVVSDPTNVLALEAARRRRAGATGVIRLAASHRVVRPQIAAFPGAIPHFRLLGLVTASRSAPGDPFAIDALREHLEFHLRAVGGFVGAGVRLRVLVTPVRDSDEAPWRSAVLEPLSAQFPDVGFGFDHGRDAGRGYYGRVCFKTHALMDGEALEIGDGGDTDWTAQLLSDRRERLFISGIGSERVASLRGGALVE